MSYLVFRGVSTESLGNVYVSRMPDHKKASKRFAEYYVKGRDGALHVDEGFSTFTMSVVLVLLGADVNERYLVNAWADGTGKLISSDDLYHAYEASVLDEIQWSRAKYGNKFCDTATIKFTCQPYMVEAVDSVLEFSASGDILNPGSATALPLIAVEGNGDTVLTVAGTEMTIASMTPGVPVYIDCANGYVWTESGATSITGGFPELPIGVSQIVFGTGVTGVTITPHWRWV